MLSLICLAVTLAPKLELGVVMNIDVRSEAMFKRHFEIASGWASYIRVGVAMDQEGWKPEIERLPFVRDRRLAVECRERGMGMDIILGGVPVTDEWIKLGKPTNSGKRSYASMPRSWWERWADFQIAAAKAYVDAYGPTAPSKIRFQLFNEPYDRGEDAAVDQLIAYLIPRIVKDGTIFGCPVDGPSLWGPQAQMDRQIDHFSKFMRDNPNIDRVIQKVPLSMYPTTEGEAVHNVDAMVKQYVEKAKKTVRDSQVTLRRPVYFSEVGVGRIYDVRPTVFGARTNELAEQGLIKALDAFRNAGFQHVTIYQTKDDTEEDASTRGYGLADRFGRLRVDLANLARLSKGEDVKLAR